MKKSLENIKHIYFLGIGGIGMSALARYFSVKGIRISGYDRTASDLTRELSEEGATIHYEDDITLIPDDIDLVIYTPAVPKDLREYETFASSKVPMYKRAQVVGMICKGKTTVAVAGSHGKTSISTLTAHILMSAGLPVTALVGGISRNYNSNYFSSGKEDIMVVEADEFDRSFLELEPDVAVISAMDPDHLDIYGSSEEMADSYADFAARIKPNGHLFIRHDLQLPLRNDVHRTGYNVDNLSDAFGFNLRIENGLQLFDMFLDGLRLQDIILQVPGRHNVENAVAAALLCHHLGVDKQEIIGAIGSFKGVRRRFDFRIRQEGLVYIDDYAHHPRELEAFIEAVRSLYPKSRITGLFQPHLYTRTRDFAEGFAASMDLLDEPWLMDIYPAREMQIPGVSSSMVFDLMQNPKKQLLSKGEVLKRLAKKKPEVFLTIGAGDIDQMIAPIEKILLG
jgi:UDP-N-acetylmuramate--alanine ligase